MNSDEIIHCESFYTALAFVAGAGFAGVIFTLLMLSGSLACQ